MSTSRRWDWRTQPVRAKVRPADGRRLGAARLSGFHPVFRDHGSTEVTPEGDVRRAFYLSYNDTTAST